MKSHSFVSGKEVRSLNQDLFFCARFDNGSGVSHFFKFKKSHETLVNEMMESVSFRIHLKLVSYRLVCTSAVTQVHLYILWAINPCKL